MAKWQEAGAAKIDVLAGQWYEEMRDTPASYAAAKQLWEVFLNTHPEWQKSGEAPTLDVAIERRDTVERGGVKMTLRAVAGDICQRALVEAKWVEAARQVAAARSANSAASADEYLQAA
jgi:hypothetical protein